MDVYNHADQKNQRRRLRSNLTDAERILWSKLRGKNVFGFKFRRQFGIDDYVIDFYCPELKLAIEVDGDTHFIGNAPETDAIRQKRIESYGIRVLRFTNNDVYKNLEGVLITLGKYVQDLKDDRR